MGPRLVSPAPACTSRTWPLIRGAGTFCVNVLAGDPLVIHHGRYRGLA
ncbi:flavin reductase family protein [Streptomyces violaceorubidus]|nr:flavin reductase family protein [Streptomyces violaceorubidus]